MISQKKTKYSPHDQLPAPEPKTVEYDVDHFYKNTARYLVKDTVRVMDNGLAIDLNKVIELEEVLVEQLTEVDKELASNKYIEQYLNQRYATQIKEYKKDRKSKMRNADYYLKEFKPFDMMHRSYFMEEYASAKGWSKPEEKLPTGVSKWPANLVKKYAATNRLLKSLLDKTIPLNTPAAVKAMEKLAKDKADMYNQKYLDQVKSPDVKYPVFNPASSTQKQELFKMLGFVSQKVSKKTGLPSWDRDEIENINKSTRDEDIKSFTQSFIDHSFAAIVKNNFIAAFYKYTVQGRLYGQYKLLGAKTGRYTSSNPNMLNMPSTKSRFAKPVKKCFVAPEGKIILAADYSALEDRVIASLSRDVNKCDIFLKNLDGHSLNALGYFLPRIENLMDITGDTPTDAINFKKLVDSGDPVADAIRQESKGPTFGLAYGAYPPKIAATLKISLEEAQEIFDNYHNVLYPGITDYRQNYVLPTAKTQGQLHLGLGFTLKTDDPEKDIRTLANATCQFWSILTALVINKMHVLIDQIGYQEDVKVISTIYDSIYFEVTNDPKIIKWVNDNLIATMLVDFMEDQTVVNEAESDIGFNWAEMLTIPNNATVECIEDTLKKLQEL
jgi:DNA polymerase I-like protein with 3'-5' exonuclease and polymerase domains